MLRTIIIRVMVWFAIRHANRTIRRLQEYDAARKERNRRKKE